MGMDYYQIALMIIIIFAITGGEIYDKYNRKNLDNTDITITNVVIHIFAKAAIPLMYLIYLLISGYNTSSDS
jgi:hypothetical protein